MATAPACATSSPARRELFPRTLRGGATRPLPLRRATPYATGADHASFGLARDIFARAHAARALLGLVLAKALGCGCGQSEAVRSRSLPRPPAQPRPVSRQQLLQHVRAVLSVAH